MDGNKFSSSLQLWQGHLMYLARQLLVLGACMPGGMSQGQEDHACHANLLVVQYAQQACCQYDPPEEADTCLAARGRRVVFAGGALLACFLRSARLTAAQACILFRPVVSTSALASA